MGAVTAMKRSLCITVVALLLVSLAFAAPTGVLVSVVGSDVGDTSRLDFNGGNCLPQPGQVCIQTYQKCVKTPPFTRVCEPEAGDNGCGSPVYCQPRNDDHARPLAEQ
jgi:hypothetical protein